MGAIIKKYKLWIIGLLLALAIVLLWFHYKSTAWERDLTVAFVGYEEVTKLNGVEDIYEIYEITNDTNRVLSNVTLVFKCKSYTGRNLIYEYGGHDSLQQGVTKEFRISGNKIKEYNEENGNTLYYDHELVKVKYKK